MKELADLQATPARLRRLAQLGYLNHKALVAGLSAIGHRPDARAWARFTDYFLLVLGALFLVSGIFFFIAFNWEDLPRFARFGVIEGAILVAVAVAHWVGLERLSGKIALTVASLLVGGLLAIFGQEYQSGADAYTLFAYWAVLIVGWVLIARFDLLWVGWLGLINLSVILYFSQVRPGDDAPVPEVLLAINILALVLWEWMGQCFSWWSQRWPARLTILVAFVFAVYPTLWHIFAFFDNEEIPAIHQYAPMIYLLFVAAVALVYSRWLPDLFMLTMAMFSAIVVLTTLIGRATAEADETLAFFTTGAAIILLAGGAVIVLRRIHLRWEEQIA